MLHRAVATTITLVVLSLTLQSAVHGQLKDWPAWRGADRTNVSTQTGLLSAWPPEGPKLAWTYTEAGKGYSGPAISDGVYYVLGTVDDSEALIALDAKSGAHKWTTKLSDILDNRWGSGPRSTPTVDGEHVYALTGTGDLVCCNRATGGKVWSVSLTRDLSGKVPNWGYCESVLIDGEKLICTPGGKDGTIAALNKLSGAVIWRSDFTAGAQYSSVVIAEPFGKKQYVQLLKESLIGVDPNSGNVLWQSEWPGRTAVVPTPIVHENFVFIASGYGVGCKLLKINADNSVEEVFVNKNMKNHHGGVLLFEGHLYGYSDGVGWACMKFNTGDLVWNEKNDSIGKGCVTCVNGLLYVLGERTGTVGLVEATPKGFSLRGKFTLEPKSQIRSPQGKIWTHPVVLDGRLYLRDQDIIHCYDISDPRVAQK
jgi:outer membrane protein assembly factor BamB